MVRNVTATTTLLACRSGWRRAGVGLRSLALEARHDGPDVARHLRVVLTHNVWDEPDACQQPWATPIDHVALELLEDFHALPQCGLQLRQTPAVPLLDERAESSHFFQRLVLVLWALRRS